MIEGNVASVMADSVLSLCQSSLSLFLVIQLAFSLAHGLAGLRTCFQLPETNDAIEFYEPH